MWVVVFLGPTTGGATGVTEVRGPFTTHKAALAYFDGIIPDIGSDNTGCMVAAVTGIGD